MEDINVNYRLPLVVANAFVNAKSEANYRYESVLAKENATARLLYFCFSCSTDFTVKFN